MAVALLKCLNDGCFCSFRNFAGNIFLIRLSFMSFVVFLIGRELRRCSEVGTPLRGCTHNKPMKFTHFKFMSPQCDSDSRPIKDWLLCQQQTQKMAEEKLKALLRSCLDKIMLQIHSVGKPSASKVSVYELLGATVCGAASFPLCLGIFQTTIFRPVRYTCNRRLAQVFGCISVALSSSISTIVFLLYPQLVRNIPERQTFSLKDRCCHYLPKLREEVSCTFTGSHIPLFVGSNVIVFKAVGGRFRSVLPSSLLHPGAFARTSFPASSHNYASSFIKQKLLVEGQSQ